MNRRWTCALAIAGSIAIFAAIKVSLAAEPDDKVPQEGHAVGSSERALPPGQAEKVSGTVSQFNYTPRGERDGILLTAEGKLVQLNIPPREASKLADSVAIGDKITAEGLPERTEADHTVFRVRKLTTAKGEEIAVEGPPRPRESEARPEAGPGEGPDQGPPRPRGRDERAEGTPGERPEQGPPETSRPRRERSAPKTETIKGTVKSLNHGARGEVDGVVLENGDFIHTGPREAEEAKLAVGQEISVEGYTMKMPDGHTMIAFPVKINDKEVSRPPRFGDRGGAAGRQPPPPGDAPPPDEPRPRGDAPPPDNK